MIGPITSCHCDRFSVSQLDASSRPQREMSRYNAARCPCASMHICVEPLDWRCGMGTDRRGEGRHRSYRELRYAFGRQVLALRTRAALTQSQLAAAMGAHRRSVQKWETGESYPKAETLQRLIAVFLARGLFTPGQET